jgi:tetratricopeptide (TPR) repeat protein
VAPYEVPFQLDGHFWLQYGLYYDRLGDLSSAEEMLRKSIQAYPNNIFAEHALARLRLRIASSDQINDGEARALMAEAVASLNRLDARDPASLDEYPLVTLSSYHIAALIKRGQEKDAKTCAREYLDRLKYFQRRVVDPITKSAIEQLTIFLATGDWRPQRAIYEET